MARKMQGDGRFIHPGAGSLYLRPVQRSPVRQKLIAYPAQGGGIGSAGGVLNAHQIEAGVMGGLGSVERILAHGAPGGLRAAKAVQRLHKGSTETPAVSLPTQEQVEQAAGSLYSAASTVLDAILGGSGN